MGTRKVGVAAALVAFLGILSTAPGVAAAQARRGGPASALSVPHTAARGGAPGSQGEAQGEAEPASAPRVEGFWLEVGGAALGVWNGGTLGLGVGLLPNLALTARSRVVAFLPVPKIVGTATLGLSWIGREGDVILEVGGEAGMMFDVAHRQVARRAPNGEVRSELTYADTPTYGWAVVAHAGVSGTLIEGLRLGARLSVALAEWCDTHGPLPMPTVDLYLRFG